MKTNLGNLYSITEVKLSDIKTKTHQIARNCHSYTDHLFSQRDNWFLYLKPPVLRERGSSGTSRNSHSVSLTATAV